MYGHHVHEAVLASGDKESGPTVHLVDEVFDHGRILEQVRVPVLPDDVPETLAERVLMEEHRIYPKAIGWFLAGRLSIEDGRVLLDGQQRPEQGLRHPATGPMPGNG